MQKLHSFTVMRMEKPWRLQLRCRRTRQSGINRRQRMAHVSVKAGWEGLGVLQLGPPVKPPRQWCALSRALR